MVERVPGGDPRPGPTTDSPSTPHSSPSSASSPRIEPEMVDPPPTIARAPTTDDSTVAARTDHGAGADHRKAPDARPRTDRARSRRRRPAARAGPRDARSADAATSMKSLTELVADLGAEPALEHVVLRLQVRVGRAHVEPVPRQRQPVNGSLGAELREHLALDRDGATRRDQVEHARLEDVEARR